jgi:regulator of protease activity HflC (stomatin/prohibitin superfamily)
MDIFLLVLVAGITLLVVVTLAKSVRVVPQQRMDVVERLGRFQRTLKPGLNLLVPFLDAVRTKVDMREQVVSFPPQPVITSDNLVVSIDTVLYFKVVDPVRATYEIANFLQAIEQLTVTTLRNVIGSLDLEKALTSREEINRHLSGVLDETTGRWGIKVTRVEIKDLRPPTDIVEAMGRQMKAERLKRAEILESEGQKQSAILKAEGLRESQIREAEGRRQAAFLDAEARERSAEAEAKATTMVSQAISAGDVQALNYFVALKYVESLRDLAASPNSKTIMIPLEAAGIAGAVAGVAELTRSLGVKPG